jgi:hypothetical protein
LGVSEGRVRQRINTERTLFGVKTSRGWRLPAFQFEEGGEVPNIGRVFKELDPGLHPLSVANWFLLPKPELYFEGDEERLYSPREWLLSGGDLEVLLPLAGVSDTRERRDTGAWEWEVWRSFGDIRETFEEKGWNSGFAERDEGVKPLMAESGDQYCIVFFKWDAATGECWFELRDKLRGRMVFVHGTHNIPTPEKAAQLLANHGGPLYEIAAPGDRPMYGLPVAPSVETR